MGQVLTGAIGLLKSNGKVIGYCKDINCSETISRGDVKGIGTIISQEKPVVAWEGTMSVSFMAINFQDDGIPDGINRTFDSIFSQILSAGSSFEDQLTLSGDGISVDVFKRVTDVIDPTTGVITPKLQPFATVPNCLITSDGFSVSEGQIATHSQSYSYLKPITFHK